MVWKPVMEEEEKKEEALTKKQKKQIKTKLKFADDHQALSGWKKKKCNCVP